MKVTTINEFTESKDKYLELASHERLILKHKGEYFEIVPHGDKMPESVSPSGDPYYDNPKNLAMVRERMIEYKSGNAELVEVDPDKSIWDQIEDDDDL